jgi:gamma-glutamylputrescine oxidase
MSRLGHEAMDCVEHYVESCGIATAGFAKTGNLRCAHNALALERLVEEAKTARNTFGDDGLTIFDRHETAAETGSTDFVGGVLNSHAGVIHPLNYVRGLGSAVRNRGGRIFERSPVLSVKREGSGVELIAPRGMVKAKRLIIATNGYSDVTPATSAARTAVIPFRSAMIATEPLPNEAFDTLVPRGRSYSETRRMMRWFRRIDDRLLFGGLCRHDARQLAADRAVGPADGLLGGATTERASPWPVCSADTRSTLSWARNQIWP